MTPVIIDTNVLLVADGQGDHMGSSCQLRCLDRLKQVKDLESVVLDYSQLILTEYHNKLSPNVKSPSFGAAFLKWILQVQGTERVSWVTITAIDHAKTRFKEFPDDQQLESTFDPADRKFVAASNAHAEKPDILEAADSKWLAWEPRLKKHGISVQMLCRSELQAIQTRKTKNK